MPSRPDIRRASSRERVEEGAMDIAAWLRDLGLPQYASAFRDADIDAEVLPDLTEADLEELGIPLGHRKRLIEAIAELGAPPPAAAAGPAASPPEGAERRQITVLFCDLVGSTALSVRLDPEDLREVIRTYHACVTQVAQRHNGFVAKYMGDGVLIYFGYPEAHEDDAEQAVRAGLALVDTVGQLSSAGERLQARVGIATGLVIVGDLIGSGEAHERG